MKAIFKKELRSYFFSPIGYIFIAIFLAFSGWFFATQNLLMGYGDLSVVFSNLTIVFVFLIPILTMRSLSEEKNSRTDQLLFTLPVSITRIVLGKVFAALTVFLAALAVTLVYPLILSLFTQPAWGEIFGNYIGFFLMGMAFITIGIFISSLTESQIVSAICTFAILLLLMIIDWVTPLLQNSVLESIVNFISITKRYSDFASGLINLESVVYYLSIVVVFVFFTVRQLEKRRWSK